MYSGFDQYQPPQFPVIHQPPQATDTEMLQARENLMETIQAFLKEYDHIPPEEKCMALLLAEERFLKIKQVVEEEPNQPEAKLEEPAAQSFLLNWNFPKADDDEYTIIYRKPKAITPDLPAEEPDNSLSMGDEHLNTIPETEKSSIKALNFTPSIPFVLEYPSSYPISVVDSDFHIEEVDTFLVLEDSIPPGIESNFDSEGDIIFSNDLLNDDPIPEYERFTFDIEPDALVINNFDELNEDEYFDTGGGEIDVSQNIEDEDSFAFVIRTFLPYRTYPVDYPLLLSTRSEDTIFDPGIST
ncbi:hypothetical protein Tco_1276315 [Tanacetum coccineum]